MDIWYTALFVADPKELTRMFPPIHEVVFAHHSTIQFEPESLEGIHIGEKWNLEILGRAKDDKGDALLVKNPKSKNKFPHITLSCKKGVDPIYSNELLEKALLEGKLEHFNPSFFIEAWEGYGDHDNKIFVKPGV